MKAFKVICSTVARMNLQQGPGESGMFWLCLRSSLLGLKERPYKKAQKGQFLIQVLEQLCSVALIDAETACQPCFDVSAAILPDSSPFGF